MQLDCIKIESTDTLNLNTVSAGLAYFKIQIFTVSGKIVKEITEMDLGQIRIGTHMTDYVWDGSDDFGAKLANGVYLYRVVAKKANGEDYDNYDSGADQYFKKGFGKLVILR